MIGVLDSRMGQLIGGKYRVEGLLATGGMGLIYRARHQITGRAVALKLLRAELLGDSQITQRVSQEARLAVDATHPNVVEVLDAGCEETGIPYLVLERLFGQPLDSLLSPKLSLVATSQVLIPIVNALVSLHERGIIHRDIKPSNIFLAWGPGAQLTPKLLDFGIAKAVRESSITRSGVALGTPAYMAPEQALGRTASGPSADIWSIAVVLVKCLTGRLPFDDSQSDSLKNSLSWERMAGIPAPLALVIERALQFEPADRFSDMITFRTEMLAALREIDPGVAWPSAETQSIAAEETELAALPALAQSRDSLDNAQQPTVIRDIVVPDTGIRDLAIRDLEPPAAGQKADTRTLTSAHRALLETKLARILVTSSVLAILLGLGLLVFRSSSPTPDTRALARTGKTRFDDPPDPRSSSAPTVPAEEAGAAPPLRGYATAANPVSPESSSIPRGAVEPAGSVSRAPRSGSPHKPKAPKFGVPNNPQMSSPRALASATERVTPPRVDAGKLGANRAPILE
ncbi:MAG TPA: protein kinase [Polyangiaceae bacterium]|nr:protein kinase [Polyangiaceae bacterium]